MSELQARLYYELTSEILIALEREGIGDEDGSLSDIVMKAIGTWMVERNISFIEDKNGHQASGVL